MTFLSELLSKRESASKTASMSSGSQLKNSEDQKVAAEPARAKTIQPSTGVKVEPAPHGANVVKKPPVDTLENFLSASCNKEYKKIRNSNIIQSSFEDINPETPALASTNGFVKSVLLAYNQHHHLVIRPEDVWFSILVQLNVYINAHAEELRDMFVAHTGQKPLWLAAKVINGKEGTTFGIDWAHFAYLIGKKIEENIKDPSLRTWFMPSFTTTTKVDQATASIIMMATMQKYFSYGCYTCCGLPSVTLLGQKSDWETILSRIERLKTFGDEPTMFYKLLKPILTRFVKTFDDPDSEDTRDFWQKIAHERHGGSGPSYLSGWITAFCFWDYDGICFYGPNSVPPGDDGPARLRTLKLDDVRYHRIDIDKIPHGYASVPVELNDDGIITSAEMVAGSIGMKVSSSGTDLEDGSTGLDTLQPRSGWCMYEVMSEEETLEKGKIQYEALRKTVRYLPEWKGKESMTYLER